MHKLRIMKDVFGRDIGKLKDKKLFLFDMDGTVYLDEQLFDGAKELFDAIERKGGRYVFVTNNAAKSVKDYVVKMHRIGLKNVSDEYFFTSAQATAQLLKKYHSKDLIYVQASASLVEELEETGLHITTEYTDKASAILVAFDPAFTGEKMYTTCKMLTIHDVPYYATNPDWVCPVSFGYVPDCGSMCQGIARATGKTPIFIGKPEPTMILEVMKKFHATAEETVVIGDRLYTDIASGKNAGIDTICVLSGEVTLQEIMEVPECQKPTFVLDSIKNIII